MKQIAIYGKGGIGKSTTSSNLSAALADRNLAVMQIGCDPKRDSTRMLMQGRLIPTVLDLIRDQGEANLGIDDVVFQGFRGIDPLGAGGECHSRPAKPYTKCLQEGLRSSHGRVVCGQGTTPEGESRGREPQA